MHIDTVQRAVFLGNTQHDLTLNPNSKAGKKNLHVIFLDLADVFGAMPHELSDVPPI